MEQNTTGERDSSKISSSEQERLQATTDSHSLPQQQKPKERRIQLLSLKGIGSGAKTKDRYRQERNNNTTDTIFLKQLRENRVQQKEQRKAKETATAMKWKSYQFVLDIHKDQFLSDHCFYKDAEKKVEKMVEELRERNTLNAQQIQKFRSKASDQGTLKAIYETKEWAQSVQEIQPLEMKKLLPGNNYRHSTNERPYPSVVGKEKNFKIQNYPIKTIASSTPKLHRISPFFERRPVAEDYKLDKEIAKNCKISMREIDQRKQMRVNIARKIFLDPLHILAPLDHMKSSLKKNGHSAWQQPLKTIQEYYRQNSGTQDRKIHRSERSSYRMLMDQKEAKPHDARQQKMTIGVQQV